jgi:glycosyltransferase involved in cell wall biosynthesis
MANHVVAHGFDKAKVHAIPLYATAPPDGEGSPEREKDLLLFAGQLIRGKGLDVLLHAMLKLGQSARLIVAGTGRQGKLFETMCDQLGLRHRVQFVGRLSRDQLHLLYRRATVVVVPSRYPETFGLVGVEAMSHGTPVIATTVGAIGEWLEDGCTGPAFHLTIAPALATPLVRSWPTLLWLVTRGERLSTV